MNDYRGLEQTEMKDLLREIAGFRSALREFPELGHREFHTARFVESTLQSMGLDTMRPAETSVATWIGNGQRAPSLGFRAELDALNVDDEETDPGRVRTRHVCGHDGHVAALLALARVLQRTPITARVLLVFQQAEETDPSGALGVLAGLTPDLLPEEFFAFHLWPELPRSVIGVRPGPLFPTVAAVTCTVTGREARRHGTKCGAEGLDAISVAAELHRKLSAEFASGRRFLAETVASLSIGMMDGGTSPNAVATTCTLRGTLRAISSDDERKATVRVRALAGHVAEQFDASVDVEIRPGIRPAVRNDVRLIGRIEEVCGKIGIESRRYPEQPVAVSDDFGWYQCLRPGALTLIGCGEEANPPLLHEARFDYRDEALIPIVLIGLELAKRAEAPAELPHSLIGAPVARP